MDFAPSFVLGQMFLKILDVAQTASERLNYS